MQEALLAPANRREINVEGFRLQLLEKLRFNIAMIGFTSLDVNSRFVG